MSDESILPPKDIPDLSDLRAQTELAVVFRALMGGGSHDNIAHTLTANCIRLLDAAVRDYSLGRLAIYAFHHARKPSETGVGYIIQASSHFESCVWHLERFIKHARALRARKIAEAELKQLIPRDAKFLSTSAESKLIKLRHTLAHLEERALKGELPPGTSIALLPLESGLSIGSHSIDWGDLTLWLREAHSCAEKLARFKPIP